MDREMEPEGGGQKDRGSLGAVRWERKLED